MEIVNECSVIFALKADPREEYFIVGNCEALGNWAPSQAVSLIPIGPILITMSTIRVLKDSKLEYKYIKIKAGQVIWETISNRKLTVKDNLYVDDVFNSPVSQIDYSQKRFELLRRDSSELKLEKIHSTNNSLVIISMHLPLKVKKVGDNWEIRPQNTSWHTQLLSVCQKTLDFIWIGSIGIEIQPSEQETIQSLLRPYNCIPVFIPEDTLKYHTLYCETILFNVLNNTIDLKAPVSSEKNTQQWEGYKMLNILFNETLFSVYSGQMVWVHGSELLLLPSFISKKVKDPVNIGFYFHRPFPSSEIFRILPHKTAILNAIGCCDLIGFQIFEHASHFIGACTRILGVDTGTTKDGTIFLNLFGRNINIYIGHIGICPETISQIKSNSKFQNIKNSLKSKYADKIVILSIDQLSALSGFILKLKAIMQVIKTRKILMEKIVFVNILISCSEKNKFDAKSSALVEELNKEAGKELVEIVQKNISHEERFAYMEISSGLIVSTVKEGMSLLPFEFLLLKKFSGSGIVLSEFAGSSRTLSSPYKVNPLDTNSFEIAILELLTNLPNKKRLVKDLTYIETKTTTFWVEDFVSQIKSSKKKTHKFQYVSIGMNDTLRMMAIPKNFAKLDEFEVFCAYKNSKNRVLLFDVEGTLLNFIKENDAFMPSDKILSTLEDLCSDTRNTVMTITGRERSVLMKWFGLVPGLNLAAEHGAYVKMNSEDWKTIVSDPSEWKDLAKKVIESHVERIEGSVIIVKESSVVFDYREADSLFGQWQAKDIVSHLERLLHDHNCQVIQCEGYVEVRQRGIDKGSTLYRTLQQVYSEKGQIDFVFTIGDDSSDEKMFKMVKMMKKKSCEILSSEAKIFTCTFGVKPSDALFYFLNADEVLKLMELLATRCSKRRHSLGNIHPRHSNHQFTAVNISDFQRVRRQIDSQDFNDHDFESNEKLGL